MGVSSWLIGVALPMVPWYPIMFFSKFFEGVGYGVLTIAILTLCSAETKDCLSEAIGTLLGAVFLGNALGQGVGGVLLNYLFSWWNLSGRFTSLQMSFLFALVISLLPLFVSIVQSIHSRKLLEPKDKISLGHFHFKELKKAFLIPSFVFLLLIYGLYDLSHGFYTPNLIVLLGNKGFTEAEAGIIFFLGDVVWGLSQIFTGKLADRFGNWLPIIFSVLLKGLGVLCYVFAFSVLFLGAVFIVVGFAEALMEPARNSEVLTIEDRLKTDGNFVPTRHDHKHINFSFVRGRGFEFGIHGHYHEHQLNKEVILGMFQIVGIVSFGIGGSLGSLLLSLNVTLEAITFIGAGIILFTTILSIFSLLVSKKKGLEEQQPIEPKTEGEKEEVEDKDLVSENILTLDDELPTDVALEKGNKKDG